MTTVALVQLDLSRTPDSDPSDIRPVSPAVDQIALAAQAGAELIVLPELWRSGPFELETTATSAETVPDATTTLAQLRDDANSTAAALGQAAAINGVWLHAGSVLERAGDSIFNTSLLFDPHGILVAKYRKRHLFGFDSGEAALLSSGDELVVVPTPLGMTGLATCYDLRFPEHFRALVDAGAESVLITSGWPLARLAHWQVLVQARAIENQCLVVAVNGAGISGEVPLAGHSAAMTAWGNSLTTMTSHPGLTTIEVDPSQTASTRADFPVLRDRIQ